MSHQLKKLLAASALALLPSFKALAQDVTLDLTKPDKNEHQSVWSLTRGEVRAEYIPGGSYSAGASIYMDWRNDYDFKITSSKAIAVIELDGITDNRKEEYTSDVLCTTGTLKMHPNETSIWTGNSTSVSFYGWQRSTRYYFTEARIWFVGTPYGKQYVADPVVTPAASKLSFGSATKGASFVYNLQLATDGKTRLSTGTASIDGSLVVNVHGEAEGFEASSPVTQNVSLADLVGKQGDANGDGRLNLIDLQAIINELLQKTVK